MEQDSGQFVKTLFADSPVESRAEDTLGRVRFAELLAGQMRVSPGGMVFGLTGPWGSGKTSVVNMVTEILKEDDADNGYTATGETGRQTQSPSRIRQLFDNMAGFFKGDNLGNGYDETYDSETAVEESPVILRFDPGLFSSTEQLAEHFFEELGAQFVETGDRRLEKVGKLMSDYGPMLGSLRFLPVIGGTLGGVGDLATHAGNRMQQNNEPTPSVNKQRIEIKAALASQPRPILVIIDDLDRLEPPEVRDMMKLVRLNADFPKTTYLLCYDRQRVERALGATDVLLEEHSAVGEVALAEGRSYLEKIVQLSYEIPPIRESDLTRILAEGLRERLSAAFGELQTEENHNDLDDERLAGIFHLVIRPLMDSLRDVKRYLNVLPAALHLTRGEVALEDVMALEAIRLQIPESHARLLGAAQALTQLPPPLGSSPSALERDAEELYRRAIEGLLEAGGSDVRETVRECILLLFPAGARHLGGAPREAIDPRRWRRDNRVADLEVFNTYLYRQLSEGTVPTAEITRLIEAAGDRQQLSELVSAMDAGSLEKIVERIGDYAEVLAQGTSVGPVIEVFLSSLPRLRQGTTGLFDFGPEPKVYSLVKNLLAQVPYESYRARLVEEALPHITNLSGKVELVELVGYGEGSGEGLVPADKARQLDERALELIEETGKDQLAAERRPTEILGSALRLDDRLGSEERQGEAYVRSALNDDRVLLAVLKDCLGYRYSSGSAGLDTREEVLQPQRLTVFIHENRATERVREVAERVGNGDLPLDPGSPEARALVRAVAHFEATPGKAGEIEEDADG